jgi:hypothetical protein
VSQRLQAQALFSIANVKFGSYVKRDSFEVLNEATDEIPRSVLTKKALWLGVTIVGDQNTMRILDNENSLWFKAVIWINGQKKDWAEIGMDFDEWERDHKKLRDELDQHGTFTWRTRMRTVRTDPGTVEIKFFDKFENGVSPMNYAGAYVAKIRIK